MKQLYIVDAFSQIFRWYHAMPLSFTAPDGMPVNAIFGMAKFLFQLQKNFEIDGGIFAFDCGGSVLRSEIHPDYKSNRPPMPEDLRVQMEPICELIDAFGWTRMASEGYEADDVIATLVDRYPEHAYKIITADKDIAQLIKDPHVSILQPLHKGNGWLELDEAKVCEKFGIPPHQIPDYLSLIGDNIDVVGGIAGIGPKTAVQILQGGDHIVDLLQDPSKITNEKWRTKICENESLLQRNLQLIHLNKCVPYLPELSGTMLEKPVINTEKLVEIFTRYGLRSLFKELGISPPSTPPVVAKVETENDLFSSPATPPPQETQDDLFANMSL